MTFIHTAMFSTPGLWTTRVFDRVSPPVVVLIVDDDVVAAQALAAVLAVEGYRVGVVDGGQGAFEMPATSTPHVVVLDIEMPRCDGYAVASAMRHSSRYAHTPIIAYTSLTEMEVLDRGRQARIDAFCRKGTSIRPLLALIKHVAPI